MKKRIRYSKVNIDSFQISNAFPLKNKRRLTRCYLYLKEKQEIKCRILNTIISFEESIANESRLSSACNRVHNCQNDDSETIQRKRTLFRRRKFDVLIRSI